MNSTIYKLLLSLGLTLTCASQAWAQDLTAAACASGDFKLRDYNLAFDECVGSFETETPVPLPPDEIAQNRIECRVARTKGLKTCASRHTAGRALDFCNRAVKSDRRACLYQARFAQFTATGPQVYRRDTCAAARSGLTEICFDYAERLGAVPAEVSPSPMPDGTSQEEPEQVIVPMHNPTPTPAGCTQTCVEDCYTQYYEDYDYNAEQLCYYDTCGC